MKGLRRNARLTQIDLAKKMKVNQATVSYWENGKYAPMRKVRKKLCRVLGCTMEELEASIAASKADRDAQ